MIHRNRFLLGMATLMSLFNGPAVCAEDVFKTLDEKGRPSFSDKPVSMQSQKVSVDVRPSNPEDAARLTREQNDASVYNERVKNSQQQNAQQQASQQADQEKRARYCNYLRDDQRGFAQGGLIYYLDENGKRVFYTSQEIEQKRAEIAATIERNCGG